VSMLGGGSALVGRCCRESLHEARVGVVGRNVRGSRCRRGRHILKSSFSFSFFLPFHFSTRRTPLTPEVKRGDWSFDQKRVSVNDGLPKTLPTANQTFEL